MLVFSDITPPDDGGYRRNWCSILSFYHRNHFTTTPAAVATLPSLLPRILWVLDASETDNKIALYGPKKAYSNLVLHHQSRAISNAGLVINWAPPPMNNTFYFLAESPVKQPFFNHNCAAHQIKNEISPITTTKQNI